MPASFPGITFKEGVCSYCTDTQRSAVHITVKGHNELRQLLGSRKGKDYDCMVPTGGGKDSSYVLYYVMKELGLKPLAFYFDNGFIVDSARQNLENICRKLSVDLVVAKATNFRRRAAIEGLLFSSCTRQVSGSMVCANCVNNALAAAKNEAVQRDIPFIIWGHSKLEGYPTEFNYDAHDVTSYTETTGELKQQSIASELMLYLSSYYNLLYCGNGLDYISALAHRWLHEFYVVRDNVATNPSEGRSTFLPFWRASWNTEKVQSVGFFDYIKYDPFRNLEILKKEIGWHAPIGRETKNDCMLHCLKNFNAMELTGITRDGFFLATLVRYGLLKRDEALAKEEAMRKSLEKECGESLKAMGLSNEIAEKILHSKEFVASRRKVLLRLSRELGAIRRIFNA